MDIQERYRKNVDVSYSYQLAKRMEKYRTNEELGYRTAGSRAEYLTGDMLAEEMRKIGFPVVRKDPVRVDGWEFERALLTLPGEREAIRLGAYQTDFVTEGPRPYRLVYAGKGTMQDYEGLDVRGKLVLVEINQRDEWWINYPVYQAHLKGAAAVIAVQSGGYGEVDDEALNAQDISGPADAAAFSVSRRDAERIKALLRRDGEIEVLFDAVSRVFPNRTTYNIVGEIPGKNPERRILLSAHYDSYFDGFQDDNTAVSMMLSMGRTLLKIGYQPENTLIFCAMASEEWGVTDSMFDWSTGAYEQVFTVHPEWRGSVIADLNFELPALAHGTRARIRSTHEYVAFLEEFLEELPDLTRAYPEDTRVTAPIETWSDDFSIAIAGIPSMVNDFTGGSFMETNYHSQFDNDGFYDEDVYRMHHELFGLLLMAIDHTAVVPLDFSRTFARARECLELDWCGKTGAQGEAFLEALKRAEATAGELYERIRRSNREYRRADGGGKAVGGGEASAARLRALEKTLLRVFQQAQDAYVRIDWYGNVLFPHGSLQESLQLLSGAVRNLREGRLSAALRKLYEVDSNRYAFLFEEEVYRHFTSYVFDQPRDRLKWGYGRIIGFENFYPVVTGLLRKERDGGNDFTEEIAFLKRVLDRQEALYREEIENLRLQTERMEGLLRQAQKECYGQ
ncbi:MAG: M28 family peptidase [Eubacteriales bacterium]|nr:M28 family peptidase [Eubacteriales bacterium]